MSEKQRFRFESGPTEGAVTEFRRQILLFLAGFTFVGAGLLLVWLLDLAPTPTGPQLGAIGVAICIALGTFLLQPYSPQSACAVFGFGSLVLASLLFVTFGQQVIVALFPLSVLISGFLLGRVPNLAVAGSASVLVLALNRFVSPIDAPPF